MFQSFRDTMHRWTGSRWMMPALGIASFLESIIVPIPLEAILIPLMQKQRHRLWLLATIALLGLHHRRGRGLLRRLLLYRKPPANG